MKAITQKRYGGPEVLEYSEVPVPTPKPDQVLIRVRAASVNAADWLLTRGEPYLVRLLFGLRAPKAPTWPGGLFPCRSLVSWYCISRRQPAA